MHDTQITPQDIEAMRNIIEIAAQRGAFHAAEMTQVGQVFDKLTIILEAAVTQVTAEQ